jgi:PRTRC genetic system ThiF family protein
MPHFLPSHLLQRRVNIDLVGCGGNGSQMLTGLARLDHAIKALGHPGLNVHAHDPDTVSEANLARQLFTAADVGQHKSIILTHRINAFFGNDWRATPGLYQRRTQSDIVIVCVDSIAARHEIDQHLHALGKEPYYVMDLGNRASDGQMLIGQPRTSLDASQKIPPGHVRLPYPYDVLPELINVAIPEDDTPSCGLAEALERQELFINQAVVTPALQLLWELFRHGRLTWHGAFINLRTGRMQPIQVKEAA